MNEVIDAQTFADWGVKYAKVDNCGQLNLNSYAKYSVMRDALNATGEKIYYSSEPHLYTPIGYASYVSNSWRSGADVGASYSKVIYEAQ